MSYDVARTGETLGAAVKKIAAIVIVLGVLVYQLFGTLSPCAILRDSARRHDGLAAVLPDSLVDVALTAQFGALSPGRCLDILLSGQGAPAARARPPQQPMNHQQARPLPFADEDALKSAWKETEAAVHDCRAKRLSGELKTYVDSAKCANPRMIRAFGAANYKYMDLIAALAASRIELALRVDGRELSEAQAQQEGAKFFARIREAEKQRDQAGRR